MDCPDVLCSPSDLLAAVRLEVYASFEFQPMLGSGEQLREFTTTIEQLLDRSVTRVCECRASRFCLWILDTYAMIAFAFLPKDGDVVSPCSSILVTVVPRKSKDGDPSTPRLLSPHSVSG